MSCDRHIDAIVDHACGAGIAPDAARHLAECAACGARFAEQRRMLEGLDDELRQALAVVPSATFVRRVQSHIEGSPERSARALWWSACAVAAAILLIIGTGALRKTDGVRPPPSDTALAPTTAATSVPTGPVVPPAADVPNQDLGPDRPVAHRVRRAPARERQDEALATAEVLVPPDQQRAIAHLMRLVRAGTFDGSRLPVDRQGESVTPAELVVPPLTIEPIEVPNVEIPTSPVPAGRNSQ